MTADKAVSAPGRTEVRRLGPDDWAVSRQVRLTALAEAPYAFMSTLAREQRFDEQLWRQRLGSPSAATFHAWVDGEPAGTATVKIDDPGDEFAVPGSWQIVGMWVDPRARGTGIADRLIDTAAGHASDAGRDGSDPVGDRGQCQGAGVLPADGLRSDRSAPAGQGR